jgi:6-pyruvoyltetrahydropterin/6-carboxytetrahydropterin synthase
MRVAKQYQFEAGHHLPGYDGPCASPHGHSYRLEVEMTGQPKFEPGASDDQMVMDFAELDERVKPLVEALDHTDLNVSAHEILGIARTTAEALALGIGEYLAERIGNRDGVEITSPYLSRVRVWETEKAWAEWSQE